MNGKKRGPKVLAVALIAMAAMSVAAAAAQAEAWYVGGTRTSGNQSVSCQAVGTLQLETIVAMQPVTITASAVECLEAIIFNEGTGPSSKAKDSGKLRFTGLSVDSQVKGCGVNEPITTNALKTELITSAKFLNTGLGDTFVPASGTTFATVTLTTCGALTGTFPVKGSTIGETADTLGTMTTTQHLTFNAAATKASEELGDKLTFGTEAAQFTGTVSHGLVGAPAGTAWGAKAE